MRRCSVFDQIDPLPGPKPHLPAFDRDLQTDRQNRCLQMRRHVIGPFIAVGDPAHRRVIGRRRDPVQPCQQIDLHIGIGIFLNQQAARGVAHHQCHHPIPRPDLAQPGRDLTGKVMTGRAARGDGEGGVRHSNAGYLTCRTTSTSACEKLVTADANIQA